MNFLQTKKKKSLTENQTHVTTAALKKKDNSLSFMTNYSQGLCKSYLIPLTAFANLRLNLVTALLFVHIISQ